MKGHMGNVGSQFTIAGENIGHNKDEAFQANTGHSIYSAKGDGLLQSSKSSTGVYIFLCFDFGA
jgi:hypothetical protein